MMTQLARVELGKDIEQTHMRNRKMISEWAYELGRRENVIEKVVNDGKTYIVVNDFDKLRTLFGKMLREVQRIKSEGDFVAGRDLVERYGVKVDRKLHEEVLERYGKLGIQPYSGYTLLSWRAAKSWTSSTSTRKVTRNRCWTTRQGTLSSLR